MNDDAPQKQDLHFRRIFESPVEKLWLAWTASEFIKMWWGPDGFTCPSAEMDVREGGVSLVCMRAPQRFGGQDTYNSWTYSRIVPNRLMEYTVHFTDKAGKRLHPAEMGMPAEMPYEVRHSIAFTELENGRTELRITEHDWPMGQTREMSRMGMEQCLDKMEKALCQ